jgi:hypothetical protein
MNIVERIDNGTHYSWVVNTEDRWCDFIIQRYCYEEGVILEELDEDYISKNEYILEDFKRNSIPYYNQEKDQIVVIQIKGDE